MPFRVESTDFGHVHAFLAVAEEQSFTAAGRRLGISGSAVGQSIKLFERSLGVQLFVRTTRKVILTEYGRSFLEKLRPAATAMADALDSTRSSSQRPQGRVRVHAPRSAAERFLVPMLAEFSTAFPDIEIHLTVTDGDPDIVAEGFDLALKIGEVIDLDLVAIRIGGELRQLAVASPGFIEANGRPEHPRDLINFSCIRWRWLGKDRLYEWEFCEDGRWFNVRAAGPLVLTDRQLILRLGLEGAGICFLGADDAQPYLETGKLINLLDAWSWPFPGWHICYPRQSFIPTASRLFIDAVRQQASSFHK